MSNTLRFSTDGIDIPHTWQELVAIKDELSTYTGATRLKEDQEYYDLYQEVIPREYILELIKKQIGERNVALIKNHFPYSRILEHLPFVKHYLLWSAKGEITPDEIKHRVEEKFPILRMLYLTYED